MRKNILFIAFLFSTVSMQAQVAQTVSIGANYPDAVYYSMQNGAAPAVSNSDWELGFQLRGFWASIIINSKTNVQAYRANKSVSQWASITPSDTVGILNSTYELRNSDLTWDEGALSNTYDTANAFDLGWGVYDFVTHAVTGDSLFFIKLPNGDFKKLWIESLTGGIFYFRWANLDGSNEIISQLDKANFTNKYFGYFSITNNTWIDREPVAYNQWDLLFHQYLAVTPIAYKVVGVLSNDSVFVEKAYPVDVANATPDLWNASMEINKIGYDWKVYDFANNIWTIEDSLVYFVRDRSMGVWKVIFTGFGGAANGNFEFTKEFIGVTGVEESSMNPLLSVYPNPANDFVNLVVAKQSGTAVFRILNTLGEVMLEEAKSLTADLSTVNFNISSLVPGMYLLSSSQNGKTYSKTFIVQ